MRRASRNALAVALSYLALTVVLVILKYCLWDTPWAHHVITLQRTMIWPLRWAVHPLLATDRFVPVFSISGRADEAAAWREMIVYGLVGFFLYGVAALVGALFLNRIRSRATDGNIASP